MDILAQVAARTKMGGFHGALFGTNPCNVFTGLAMVKVVCSKVCFTKFTAFDGSPA